METLERQYPFRNYTEHLKYLPLGSSNWVTANTFYRSATNGYLTTERTSTPDYWNRLKRGELLPHTPFRQFQWGWDCSVDGVPVFDGRYEFTDTAPSPDRYYVWGSEGYSAGVASTTSLTTPSGFAFGGVTVDLLDTIATSRSGGNLMALPQQAAANMAQSGFDATTFMAEIASTRRLLTKTVESGISAIKNFNRLKRRALRMNYSDWLQSISDAWLTGRYGFRPLLYDVKDLHQLVKDVTGSSQQGKHQSQRAGVSEIGEWAVYSSPTSNFWTVPATFRDQINYTLSFRGSVSAELRVPLSNVDNNLAVTAWELIPFSFVIDWIANVGNAIAATEFLLNAKAWTASYGYQISGTVRRYVNVSPTPRSGVTIHHFIPPSLTASFVRTVRVPTTVSNLPVLRVRLDAAKTADAAALLTSYFLRKRR